MTGRCIGHRRRSLQHFVVEEELSRRMEGAVPANAFPGVTSVSQSSLTLCSRTGGFWRQDYQQAAIIKRMVRDLNFPVKIVVAPTFREPDGLAMSSRNRYLEGDLRSQALVLRRSIQKVQAELRAARRPIPAARLNVMRNSLSNAAIRSFGLHRVFWSQTPSRRSRSHTEARTWPLPSLSASTRLMIMRGFEHETVRLPGFRQCIADFRLR